MRLSDFGPPPVDEVSLDPVAIGRRYGRPGHVETQRRILLNAGVTSVTGKPVPHISLSNIYDRRIGTTMPYDVYAMHTSEMLMGQIHGIERAPHVALALDPVEMHANSPDARSVFRQSFPPCFHRGPASLLFMQKLINIL